MRITGPDIETSDKYIAYAVEGAMRMQTLIEDLLAFSRAGRNGAKSPTDSDSAVNEAIKNLAAAVQDSELKITLSSLPILVAYRVQLVHLFQNLISPQPGCRRHRVLCKTGGR